VLREAAPETWWGGAVAEDAFTWPTKSGEPGLLLVALTALRAEALLGPEQVAAPLDGFCRSAVAMTLVASAASLQPVVELARLCCLLGPPLGATGPDAG